MARYTGSVYKKSRRFGFSTLENGKELARKPYPPGIHGTSRRKKVSEYGIQLNEKQKVRFMYGLKLSGVNLNRKMLSEMAIHEPEAFTKLVGSVKETLSA